MLSELMEVEIKPGAEETEGEQSIRVETDWEQIQSSMFLDQAYRLIK